MKAIIKWELWQRRWSIMWWTIGIAIFIIVNLAFYPAFKDQSQELSQALNGLPESAVSLFSDTGEFFSPVGYLSSQIYYLLLPLLLGILSISLGASLIGRDEKEGTIELLLSRPISRTKLLASKALAGVIISFIVGLVATLVIVITSKIVDLEVPLVDIALTAIVCWILSLSFGAVAFMISSFGRARIASIGIATIYALAGYIIASLISLASWLKWPAKGFPFDYYQPANILEANYNWLNMIFFIKLIILCAIISWLAFRKRDITS